MIPWFGGDGGSGQEEDEEQGSPMDVSTGKGTPQSEQAAPWITDEQEIVPTPTTNRPEWMTRSHEASPSASEPKKKTKRQLAFVREDEEMAEFAVLPRIPLVQPAVAHTTAIRPSTGHTQRPPDLYDVSPFGDVDFVRLAKEQADTAKKLNQRPPGESFVPLDVEHVGIDSRLERVLRSMLAREESAGIPIVIVYAGDLDLDPRERPLILWRSAPGPSRLVLRMGVVGNLGAARFDSQLRIDGPASIGLARVDLFTDVQGPVHFLLREKDDDWVLEAGHSTALQAVDVVLLQQSRKNPPQWLRLQPLLFGQARIEANNNNTTSEAQENVPKD